MAGGIGLTVLVLLLSSTILPPWPILAALIVFLAGATAFAWRPVARLYERTSLAIEATPEAVAGPQAGLPPALRDLPGDMELEKIAIGGSAAAVGRRIRELEIRSRTGASVVAVERGGQRIVNPSPDEEMQAGDNVFLLGDAVQRRTARDLLGTGRAPKGSRPRVPGST